MADRAADKATGAVKKSVDIRGVAIGGGIPKICVPVAETTPEAILREAGRAACSEADVLEWRADYYVRRQDTDRVLSVLAGIRREIGPMPLLVTYRTQAEGGAAEEEISPEDYLIFYQAVLSCGQADLIDVELRMGGETVKRLTDQAHRAGQAVLLSSHDFNGTPEEEEMRRRFRQMEEWGADILKLAVMPSHSGDMLRLMAVCREVSSHTCRPVIAISMGAAGVESRICGEAIGSAMTFGCLGKASAPGQIDVRELAGLLKTLHRLRGEGNRTQASGDCGNDWKTVYKPIGG